MMKSFIQKKLFFSIILLLVLTTACSNKAKNTSETSQISPEQMPLDISYCNIVSSDLCLEGFGQEEENKLLILFKAENPDFADIYIQAKENSVIFTCSQSQNFPENIYCIGGTFPNGEDIRLNIYAKKDKKLVATGEFKIQHGVIQRPDNDEFEDSTPESSYPNYPNSSYENPTATPSYPNYPNSSYENPTATP